MEDFDCTVVGEVDVDEAGGNHGLNDGVVAGESFVGFDSCFDLLP